MTSDADHLAVLERRLAEVLEGARWIEEDSPFPARVANGHRREAAALRWAITQATDAAPAERRDHVRAGQTGAPAGERIREARRAAGLSLDALGQRVGIGAPHLSKIETGSEHPSPMLTRRLARELGLLVRVCQCGKTAWL